jgi:RimJ/RimL family protein N-acetyltransferase
VAIADARWIREMPLNIKSAVELVTATDGTHRFSVPIRTTRLELRPFRESDIDCIASLLGNPQATQFMGGVLSRDDAAKAVLRMRDSFAARGWGTLAVVPFVESECVGYCGVRPLTHTADVEVAFALQPRCWNLGYATEAATACVDEAFKTLGVESIVATVYPDNKACCRVLTKLGMTQESAVFGHWPRECALLFRLGKAAWLARPVSSA